jgi:hypothetical protein
LKAFTARLAPDSAVPVEAETLRWVTPAEVAEFALPVAHQKIAAQMPGLPAAARQARIGK